MDMFLSYTSPTESTTNLPTGATTYNLTIIYGQTVIPSTFTAVLNNVNISSLFNPVAGTSETVTLSGLRMGSNGRNVLDLSIDGYVFNNNSSKPRVTNDSDKLTFIVR